MSNDLEARSEEFARDFGALRDAISRVIVGHEEVIEGILTALFVGGHCLLEGVPGLGKTLLVRSLSQALDAAFSRVQFTPDLMPADVLGTRVYLTEGTDAGLSYSFTYAESRYRESDSARELDLIDDNRVVDGTIHGLHTEVRREIIDGLSVLLGYRFQHYSDGARRPTSLGSARRPPVRSDTRHTVSFGVTLDSELFAER